MDIKNVGNVVTVTPGQILDNLTKNNFTTETAVYNINKEKIEPPSSTGSPDFFSQLKKYKSKIKSRYQGS